MIMKSHVLYSNGNSALFLDTSSLTEVELTVAITVPVGIGTISASIQTFLVVKCKKQTFLYTQILYFHYVTTMLDL